MLLDEDSGDEDYNSQDGLHLQEDDDYASPDEFELIEPRKTHAAKTVVDSTLTVVKSRREKLSRRLFYPRGRKITLYNVMYVSLASL